MHLFEGEVRLARYARCVGNMKTSGHDVTADKNQTNAELDSTFDTIFQQFTTTNPDLCTLQGDVKKLPNFDLLLQETHHKIKKASFEVENTLGVEHVREMVFN